MKCFSLNANGSDVTIQVNMPDDQVDFEHRRDINLHPLQDLKPGTVYKLIISGQLMAKNGMSLGSTATVSFTTTGSSQNNQANNQNINTEKYVSNSKTGNSVNPGSAASSQQPTVTIKNENTAKDGIKAVSVDTKDKTEVKSEAKSKNNNKENKTANNSGIAIAAGLVLIVAGGYGYYEYTHKN
jgi:hypothetical protein